MLQQLGTSYLKRTMSFASLTCIAARCVVLCTNDMIHNLSKGCRDKKLGCLFPHAGHANVLAHMLQLGVPRTSHYGKWHAHAELGSELQMCFRQVLIITVAHVLRCLIRCWGGVFIASCITRGPCRLRCATTAGLLF